MTIKVGDYVQLRHSSWEGVVEVVNEDKRIARILYTDISGLIPGEHRSFSSLDVIEKVDPLKHIL